MDDLVPPPELLFDGSTTREQFMTQGMGFTHVILIGRAQLKPHERVLDLGSGNGQKARVLAGYLNAEGRYNGIDIVRSGIEWCQGAYASYPNFSFTLASDLYSSHYNPEGRVRAHEYELPYPDASFDLVFCVSLFTHMMPNETANYLKQIGRVLKPNGRLVMTAFLLNDDTMPNVTAGSVTFPHSMDGYLIADATNPSKAVAVHERCIRSDIASGGMRVCEITYGSWANGSELLGALQDCIIAVKRHCGVLGE